MGSGLKHLAVAGTAICGVAAHAAGDITDLAPPNRAGIERGIVQIVCAEEDNPRLGRLTRGALLDVQVPHAAADVILTTAHGLPMTAAAVTGHCRAVGPRGRLYAITRVWRSDAALASLSTDWAVLLTTRRIGGDVGRLRAAWVRRDSLAELAETRASVHLLVRSGLFAGTRTCHVLPNDVAADASDSVIYHSCYSWPGLSGSPLLVGIDGAPVVVAIQVAWGVRRGERGLVGIGRVLDGEVAAAIEAATLGARRGTR